MQRCICDEIHIILYFAILPMVSFKYFLMMTNGYLANGDCEAETVQDVLSQIAEWWGWNASQRECHFQGYVENFRFYQEVSL